MADAFDVMMDALDRVEVALAKPSQPTDEQIENGEFCAICWREIEETGRPCACEECGGDAVLTGGKS